VIVDINLIRVHNGIQQRKKTMMLNQTGNWLDRIIQTTINDEANKHYVIAGKTQSGKTTLSKLIMTQLIFGHRGVNYVDYRDNGEVFRSAVMRTLTDSATYIFNTCVLEEEYTRFVNIRGKACFFILNDYDFRMMNKILCMNEYTIDADTRVKLVTEFYNDETPRKVLVVPTDCKPFISSLS
jgi:ABC-type lipoprotein export system ATPase subunit